MARIRNDYENSWFPRLLRWLKGGSDELDQELQAELVDQTRGYTREHIDSLAQARENRSGSAFNTCRERVLRHFLGAEEAAE